MGNVCPRRPCEIIARTLIGILDPLPDRTYPHYWHPEDICLLRETAKTERDGCIHGWHTPDLAPVAADRLPGRAVRDIRALWGFLCNHRFICWQHPGRGSLYPAGSAENLQRAAER